MTKSHARYSALLGFSLLAAIALMPQSGAYAEEPQAGKPTGQAGTQPIGGVKGVALAPHRAAYELSLGRADTSSGIAAARGRLALEFGDVCNGFTQTQRIRTALVSNDGDETSSDFSLTTFESRDGKLFRFNNRNSYADDSSEEYIGVARLKGVRGGGKAEYSKPAGQSVDVASGVMFPTEHIALLIEAAKKGQSNVPAKVFDGSGASDEATSDVSAIIGRELPVEAGKKDTLLPLKGLRSWPVRLAYFKSNKQGDTPQYEVGFRLYENGISEDIVIDHGEFALKGSLTLLQLLPRTGC